MSYGRKIIISDSPILPCEVVDMLNELNTTENNKDTKSNKSKNGIVRKISVKNDITATDIKGCTVSKNGNRQSKKSSGTVVTKNNKKNQVKKVDKANTSISSKNDTGKSKAPDTGKSKAPDTGKSKAPSHKKSTDIKIVESMKSERNTNTEFDGIDILISFDTTGSMYPVLAQVRREIDNLISNLISTIDNINIGVIAHGDYCDANNPYTIRFLDFTTDRSKLSEFVIGTKPTYGGDADECYELVLKTARTEASWRSNTKKILMVIGDSNPHGTNYPMNKDRIDWEHETKLLSEAKVQIFAVHCLSKLRQSSKTFYTKLANTTNGVYLTLDQFNDIVPLINATCYSQYSEEKLNDYITIIRDSSRLTNGVALNINRLTGKQLIEGIFDRNEYDDYTSDASRKSSIRTKSTSRDFGRHTDETRVQHEGLIPVTPGRFQTMDVDADTPIKEFIDYNGIIFQRGRGFYELSKSEKVQQYKEIILEDRKTGEMFTGAQVREYLGLQPQIKSGGVTERLNSHHTKDYRVYVQSTSINRKLIAGTRLLYEVELDR